MGTRAIAPHWITELIKRDFVVVSIDYRLCPQISVLDGPIKDTRDAYHWCREQLPAILSRDAGVTVNENRIVALGWSAGGHLSMMLGGNEEKKPCAIMNAYGPLSFQDTPHRPGKAGKIMPPPMITTEQSLDFDDDFMNKIFDEPVVTSAVPVKMNAEGQPTLDFSQPRAAWHFGHLGRGDWLEVMGLDGKVEGVDPAVYLGKDYPPTFFLWGEDDVLVDVKSAKDACDKLRACGVDSEITIAEGMGHAFGAGLVEGTEEYEKFVVRPIEFLSRYVDKA